MFLAMQRVERHHALGHLPGGLGHINVTVSMLFAGISGSSTADAAGIGSLMIPAMKKGMGWNFLPRALGEEIQRGLATPANTHFRFGRFEAALTDWRRHLEAELA